LKFESLRIWIEKYKSLPSRGAWIEIRKSRADMELEAVAPLTGSVD